MSRVRVPLLTPVMQKAPASRRGLLRRWQRRAYGWCRMGTVTAELGNRRGRGCRVSGVGEGETTQPSAVLVGDRYALEESIGRGGMADVYRSVDQVLGRTVAVKVLREVTADET